MQTMSDRQTILAEERERTRTSLEETENRAILRDAKAIVDAARLRPQKPGAYWVRDGEPEVISWANFRGSGRGHEAPIPAALAKLEILGKHLVPCQQDEAVAVRPMITAAASKLGIKVQTHQVDGGIEVTRIH